MWLINQPVKVAYVDGRLLLEAHPPVDEQGQTVEPNLELLSQLLDHALGNSTAAIHWDFARETLQAASGIPTVVGLEAVLDTPPAEAGPAEAPPPTGTAPVAPSGAVAVAAAPAVAPDASTPPPSER